MGTIATYFCEEGADLVGEELRLCLPTGEWSGSAPACECKWQGRNNAIHQVYSPLIRL